jgi:hypothetical protein
VSTQGSNRLDLLLEIHDWEEAAQRAASPPWRQIAWREARQHEAEYLADWDVIRGGRPPKIPFLKPRRRLEVVKRSRSRSPLPTYAEEVSRDAGDDVLYEISPHDYWVALTGEPVEANGRARCPVAGHEDVHPSVVVYQDPGRGWWCPVCDLGGSAIDLAAVITGIKPRGGGYIELRRWIAERLLNAPLLEVA